MFKHLLLGTDGSPGAGVATEYAIWLAHKLSARIHALHIIDIRILEGPLLADLSGAFGAAPYSAVLPQIKEFQTTKAAVILAEVADQCRKRGVPCDTADATGSLVHTLLEHERDVDLVILGQRGQNAPWQGDMLGSSVERLVRASIKPCLIAPAQFREPHHIIIAHDGSTGSTKGLHTGLDLAAALDMPVTLVTACQREHEDAAAKILQQAHALAESHGLKSHAQLVHDNPETAILHLTKQADCDLIVMGAYGHTRIREWILGSTTSHIIRKAPVPVLLARGTDRE